MHTDFVSTFVRRRKIIPINFAGALPRVMELRHTADYEQPGVSQRQAEKAVREAKEFVAILRKEVFHAPEA